MTHPALTGLATSRQAGHPRGITSVCSAHPLVIEAALRTGQAAGSPVLIEATCNQVNQEGGYTGMTPADFRAFVERIAASVGFDVQNLILGGDHLGPNPWRHLPAEEAMSRATVMIGAYVAAGFSKIHLDASMACLAESDPLPTALIAGRAARLAQAGEAAAASTNGRPVYVIGTEVPIPGGAMEEISALQVTRPGDAIETIEAHRRAFAGLDLADAFGRTVGLVVQPGVEFGNANVIRYERAKAVDLARALDRTPQLVFEAHSTDYQPLAALSALVEDGFAILKVGPGLTFALREALYALDDIAAFLDGATDGDGLRATMERLMLREPGNWQKYYHGDAQECRVLRHFSYSDRIRYYWPHPEAAAAVSRLMARLGDRAIPETLVSQHLASLYPDVASGLIPSQAHHLLVASVEQVLRRYAAACSPR
ncbi:MAG TPA: D-tagatose-bisphosphate aldolase, class II, non-catalytic subunit [Dongiaceae bacterium]|nr:D-tagatose-bisphosphate aldolase, class II, non-catalytic subunit [Dongiaceae bacterium]